MEDTAVLADLSSLVVHDKSAVQTLTGQELQ